MRAVDPGSATMRRPPSADGMGTGTTLALLVHAGLIAALAFGVAWRRHDVNTVSAELWAAVPQVAAPAPTEAPPPPPPRPTPAPPAPTPPRPAPTPPQPDPQAAREAEIALERARKQAEAERVAAELKKAELKKAEERRKAEEQAQKERREAAAKAEQEKREKEKQEKEEKAALAKTRAEAAQKARAEKAESERIARLRQENLQRLNRELGDNPAVGNATTPSAGRAAQSAAPSAGYEGRIRARILPHIVFTGSVSGSVVAEVEVRVAPDGLILGKRLKRSSGVPEWDEAVLRAIDKTEMLPRDVDGRVPPVMELSFDPNKR